VSVLVSIAALGITACGAQRSTACAPPLGPRGGRVIPEGARATVTAGTIVYVALVEPDKYTSQRYPQGFPWLSTASSNPHVLVPTPLCAHTAIYSLPVSLSAFRATHAGEATLAAPLASPWRSLKRGPRPYQSTVTIHD
jgi:hypothetical protein